MSYLVWTVIYVYLVGMIDEINEHLICMKWTKRFRELSHHVYLNTIINNISIGSRLFKNN